jgi:predicted transcriptional regulator
MTKGKMSVADKYAIQGMIQDGKSHKEIAKLLGRTVPTIKKYVEGELDSLHEAVVNNINLDSLSEDEPEPEVVKKVDTQAVIRKAIDILKNKHGFNIKQATDLADRVATKIRLNGIEFPLNPAKFARLCTQNVGAMELTGTHQGVDGESTSAMMNKAASVRGDEARAKARRQDQPSRTAKNAIWQPKQGQMKGE